MSSTLTFALTGLLPQTPKSGSFSNLMYAIVIFQFNIIFFYNYKLNFQLDFDFQEPCLLSHIRIYNKSVLEWEIAVGLRYKVGQPFRFCLHFIYFFCVFYCQNVCWKLEARSILSRFLKIRSGSFLGSFFFVAVLFVY